MSHSIKCLGSISNENIIESNKVDVNGVAIHPEYTNSTTVDNTILYPPAPDGTETYDSATGETVQFGNSTLAFAAESVTNKVVTSRQDYVFLEMWHEKISTSGKVFPLGNSQYGAGSYEGISLSKGYAQGYSAFGEWDTETHGYCADWDSLTDAQKAIFIQDPENNIYNDNGELIQVRYRIRVIKGLGDDWQATSPNGTVIQAMGYDSSLNRVKLRGSLTTAQDLDAGNSDIFVNMASSNNVVNAENGLWQASKNSSIVTTHNGLCFAIPIALVQRRNQGGYHPVYNPVCYFLESGRKQCEYSLALFYSSSHPFYCGLF